MKMNLNLVASTCLAHVIIGTGWLVYTALSLFDNQICSTLAPVLLLICLIMSIKSRNNSTQSDDEMSEYNLMKAKATTMEWLKTIVCVALLVFSVSGLLHEFFPAIKDEFNINFETILTLIMGITEIVTGFLFVKYEKDGE